MVHISEARGGGNDPANALYLTTDIGLSNENTLKFIRKVTEIGIPLTVFITGEAIRDYPEIVKEISQLDVQIGNHTWTHKSIVNNMSADEILSEIKTMEKAYYEFTGKQMDKIVRLPEGIFSISVLDTLKNAGYKTVFWGCTYADWNQNSQPSYEEAWDTLNARTRKESIVLLHAFSKCNADNINKFIANWKEQGYTFRPLQRCFDSWMEEGNHL